MSKSGRARTAIETAKSRRVNENGAPAPAELVGRLRPQPPSPSWSDPVTLSSLNAAVELAAFSESQEQSRKAAGFGSAWH
jgi:hypothetical protein